MDSQTMSQIPDLKPNPTPNPTPNPNPSNSTWGLGVPGRTATPSEGFAQAYARVGPADAQKTRKFENGTCLTFGPLDPVDEFDGDAGHPFMNQIALVDKAIRDIKVTRQRYEGLARVQTRFNTDADGASVSSGETLLADAFDNFRTETLESVNLTTVTLESGTYTQVPSKFAAMGTLVSVYSTINKSEFPGKKHPGYSVDNRFGNANRANGSFRNLPYHVRNQIRQAQNEAAMEEIRANYIPRSGRQPQSTTRGYNNRGRGGNHHLRGNHHRYRNNHAAGNHQINGNYQVNGNHHTNVNNHGENPIEHNGKTDPLTRPDPVTLIGSQTFSSQSGQVEGYPPKINVTLHPGQEYANKMYAERMLEMQHHFENSSGQHDQGNNGDRVDASQLPGSLVARAAQIVPCSASLPGVVMNNGNRAMENVRGPQAFVYHPSVGTGDNMGVGMIAKSAGQMVPTFKQMLSQKAAQRLPSVEEMLAGLAAQEAFLDRNIGGMQQPGFPAPVMMQGPSGGPMMYYPAPPLPQHMFDRQGTPTPMGNGRSLQGITNMQTTFADLGVQDPLVGQDMLALPSNGQGMGHTGKRTRRGQRSNRALAQKADSEYACFMDELNEESRLRGDTLLDGDALSGHSETQVRFNIQPPSPMRATSSENAAEKKNTERNELVEPEEQEAWSDLMTSPKRKIPLHHLNPAVFDGSTGSFIVPPRRGPHLLAATRPSTQSPRLPVLQNGRNSAPLPPRSRPALLSPNDLIQGQGHDGAGTSLDVAAAVRQRFAAESNLIFGEKPGSVSSRDPSPAGTLRRTVSGRRLYEK